jgi:hypothetical protein
MRAPGGPACLGKLPFWIEGSPEVSEALSAMTEKVDAARAGMDPQ